MLNGQKIETRPAEFTSIEIAGIPKNISEDKIEEFINNFEGELVQIS